MTLRPGMSLAEELAERNRVVASLRPSAGAPRAPRSRKNLPAHVRRELEWRDEVIRSLGKPAPPSAFVQELEAGRPLTQRQFVNRLNGSEPVTQSEWERFLGIRSEPSIYDVPTHVLLDDAAARGRYIAALNARAPARTGGKATVASGVSAKRRRGVRGLLRMPSQAHGGRVIAVRAASAGDGPAMLEGHFAVFNTWTEIDSLWEGNFMESIAPGAFSKTFKENRANMRVLFQHGRDPSIGDKPLGPIDELDEDDIGAHYVVPLLNTSYNSDLIPGLRANLYGASFRFEVVKETVDNKPAKSDFNPRGIPQRTVREMKVPEFGPVTFPAYETATAGLRSCMVSLTDEFADAHEEPAA
ncbi:MAG: HK97 family phage prohead protease [Candidatus Dormibacteria bacterium]